MSTINLTAHGLVGGERIVLSSMVGGAPLDTDFVYFVLAAGITANTFQISETDGGTPLTFATITSANMQIVPEDDDIDTVDPGYTAISDPVDVMAPPEVDPAPSGPTVTSSSISGVVRLKVTL